MSRLSLLPRRRLLPFLLALAAAAPAQRAADYAGWHEAFLDRIGERLDTAELTWPGRFSRVRSNDGY